METVKLEANYREKTGKAYRKELSLRGMVPGVVYGKATGGSIPLEINFKSLKNILTNAKNSVIDLTITGGNAPQSFKVLVKDTQYDPIKRSLRNIDFHQISMEHAITTAIAITFNGEVKLGVPQFGIRELQISCLPTDIPSEIIVDVAGLEVGETISVKDLNVPGGVEIIDDPDALVVTVLAERKVEEPTEEAAEAPAEAPAGE